MKASNKWIIITGSIWAVVLSAVILFLCLCKPLVNKYFYFGDRVRADISVTVDGTPVAVNTNSVKCSFNRDKIDCLCDVQNSSTVISTKAGTAGEYEFRFKAGKVPIKLSLAHIEWWDICDYSVKIDVDTKAETVSCNYSYSHFDENSSRLTTSLSTDGKVHKNTYCLKIYEDII